MSVIGHGDGAYKLEGAVGEPVSPIQDPRLRKPQKTAPPVPAVTGVPRSE